mmetsp:Transcript_41745/g.81828  ORF Transcript_41745/g.81828 Transcript_41745/m.81828 type:complete len:1357 (-) Transcript_41745:245-4315(-)
MRRSLRISVASARTSEAAAEDVASATSSALPAVDTPGESKTQADTSDFPVAVHAVPRVGRRFCSRAAIDSRAKLDTVEMEADAVKGSGKDQEEKADPPHQGKRKKLGKRRAATTTKKVASETKHEKADKENVKNGVPAPVRGKKRATKGGRGKGHGSTDVVADAEAPSPLADVDAVTDAIPIVPGMPDGEGDLVGAGVNSGAAVGSIVPHSIEYSKTGRSTCKTCMVAISKGALRIKTKPLFRGKPGFPIYKHLECAEFPPGLAFENIEGWEDLRVDDAGLLKEALLKSAARAAEGTGPVDPDELVPTRWVGKRLPPPPGLSPSVTMLGYQFEGVSWMHGREISENVKGCRGGVLADEMGMGKTLQAIAAALNNMPALQHSAATEPVEENRLWVDAHKEWEHEMDQCEVPKRVRPKNGPLRGGMLVVCPVSALSQWAAEVEKFTVPSTLTVCTYHGPDRKDKTPAALLAKYDVVLTTYQVLEAEMRAMVSPNKVKCPNCGGKYKADKLHVHLKYFCGEGAERTEAQRRTVRREERPAAAQPSPDGKRKRGEKKSLKNRQVPEKVLSSSDEDDRAYLVVKKKLTKGSKELQVASTGGSSRIVQMKGNSKGKKLASATARKGNGTSSSMGSKRKRGKETRADSDVKSRHAVGCDDIADGANDLKNTAPQKRPRRAAAANASSRLSEMAETWGGEDDEDDAFVSPESESESDESLDPGGQNSRGQRQPQRNKKGEDTDRSLSSSLVSSSSEEDEDVLENEEKMKRVRVSQQKAYKRVMNVKNKNKNPSKKDGATKKIEIEIKGKNKKFKKNGGVSPGSSKQFADEFEVNLDKLVKEATKGARMSVLHSICWWRVVLDEAHTIKSRASQTAKAAFALTAVHRWCLSGTPLQNRVGEFYSLIRFLRIDPMAHYFCRAAGCNCKSLHYRMWHSRCRDCGHSATQHFSHFNRHVLNPIQRDGYSGDGRRAMLKLKREVLDLTLLRRTKDSCADDLFLPQRLVSIRTVRLHPIEEDFYNALYTQGKSTFDEYVSNGTILNNYAHIFDLLMRMRQAVSHPYLVVYSKKNTKTLADGRTPLPNGPTDCEICHETATNRLISSCCSGSFCRTCVLEYMDTAAGLQEGRRVPCPGCEAPFSIDLNQQQVEEAEGDGDGGTTYGEIPSLKEIKYVPSGSVLRRINLSEFATSSKIEALTEELVRMRRTSPGSKAIVFSQFVSMLDLIRWRLHSDPCLSRMGLGIRTLFGGMNVKARDESLEDFKNDSSVRVLMISLKAGGQALNLTVANHIFLMDPWWNPAAEMQAIDRTHRFGQHRAIHAVRFIATNTVEERILQLQEKKRLVFDGTVGGDAKSLTMLNVDDMKSLFC